MANLAEYRKIYRAILDGLENGEKDRRELIDFAAHNFGLTENELADRSVGGRYNFVRSIAGTIINEMEARELISFQNGIYSVKEEKPIVLRIERCEEEILRLLRESPKTKNELKDALVSYFGTDETPTNRDDNKLFTYIGSILKRLTADGSLILNNSVYSISPEKSAILKCKEEVLAIKADFLNAIHARGGEFFERYFMTLLEKYLTKYGKTVTSNEVMGGSFDGGIDGVIKTVDSLGFREITMVQTKNRRMTINETEVRGFYGAVCAKQGSRGIFATTADFHEGAADFLNSIDNCIGVDGAKIFDMALTTSYGIKREGKTILIDKEII